MVAIVEEACHEAFGKEVVWLKTDLPLGLAIKYETPETLGSDRLANVLGALELHRPPFIIVDCGTATKIEAINAQGEYLGGAILPGIRMSLRALSAGTAQLPNIEPDWPAHVIGRNTTEAIQSGVVAAHAHAVMGMIRDYEKELGRLQCVVFTGGDCDLIYADRRRNALRGLHTVEAPELTLTGLMAAGKRLALPA
jgi:type III pantothenate kinase